MTGRRPGTTETVGPPLPHVFFSGQRIDEEQDMGYGPAHYFTPGRVKEVNKALAKISGSDFRQRYNAGKLNEKAVYPRTWRECEDDRNYLANNFEGLKAFYSKAAQGEQAIVTYIT